MTAHYDPGEDYVGIDEIIVFEIEDREIEVQTLILDDNFELEEVEVFLVSLTPINGTFPVAVQDATTVVFITDNDGE